MAKLTPFVTSLKGKGLCSDAANFYIRKQILADVRQTTATAWGSVRARVPRVRVGMEERARAWGDRLKSGPARPAIDLDVCLIVQFVLSRQNFRLVFCKCKKKQLLEDAILSVLG